MFLEQLVPLDVWHKKILVMSCSSVENFTCEIKSERPRPQKPVQGDQIGQIFAYWAIVYFWQFFYYRSSRILGLRFSLEELCINFDKMMSGSVFRNL
jgi:hypothetical protein